MADVLTRVGRSLLAPLAEMFSRMEVECHNALEVYAALQEQLQLVETVEFLK